MRHTDALMCWLQAVDATDACGDPGYTVNAAA